MTSLGAIGWVAASSKKRQCAAVTMYLVIKLKLEIERNCGINIEILGGDKGPATQKVARRYLDHPWVFIFLDFTQKHFLFFF